MCLENARVGIVIGEKRRNVKIEICQILSKVKAKEMLDKRDKEKERMK